MPRSYSKVRMDTHIEILSGKFNIQEENIRYYCRNNNVSPNMTKRLIKKYKQDKEKM